MRVHVSFYVDEFVKGQRVTTAFDTKAAADRYAAVKKVAARIPRAANESTFGQKLFSALAR